MEEDRNLAERALPLDKLARQVELQQCSLGAIFAGAMSPTSKYWFVLSLFVFACATDEMARDGDGVAVSAMEGFVPSPHRPATSFGGDAR